jgi:DNA repair protein RadA/Sms
VAEAKRLGFSTIIDADSSHLREAMRRAFASAITEQADVPVF